MMLIPLCPYAAANRRISPGGECSGFPQEIVPHHLKFQAGRADKTIAIRPEMLYNEKMCADRLFMETISGQFPLVSGASPRAVTGANPMREGDPQ